MLGDDDDDDVCDDDDVEYAVTSDDSSKLNKSGPSPQTPLKRAFVEVSQASN